MKPTHRLRFLLLQTSAALALLVNQATALTIIWNGAAGAPGNWSAANWVSGTPVAGDLLQFGGVATTTTNNDLTADTSFLGIDLTNNGTVLTQDQAFTLAGARITLGGNITTTAVTGTALNDTISLAMILDGNRTITTNTLHNLAISGVISETGGSRTLTKNGTGTLTLSGNNTFSGTVTVAASGGVIVANHNNALGSGTVALAGQAATLELANGITVANNMTVATSGNFKIVRLQAGASSATYAGNIVNSEDLGTNFDLSASANGTLTVSGIISSGVATAGFEKIGAGTVTLTNANTYTGGTTITTGTLSLGNGGTTGRLTATTAIVNNSNLTINRSDAFSQATDLGAGVLISGAGSFTQAGAGTTTLTAANTYSGTTTINSGTLRLEAVTTTVPTTVTTNYYNTNRNYNINNGSTLVLATGTSTSPKIEGTVVNIDSNGGATITLDGINGLIQSSAGFTINSSGGAQNKLTSTGGAGFNDQVNDRPVIFNVTSGSNATADFLVTGGMGRSGITKNGSGKLLFTTGNVGTYGDGIETITIAGGIMEIGGSITLTQKSGMPFTNNGTFSWNSTANKTLANIISGSGALTKSNASTLTLTGANTYTGATTVNAGTLTLASTGSIATSSSLAVGAAGSLDTSAQATYTIPGAQPLAFGIDAAGSGASGKIVAAGLDISSAVVTYNITGTPDDPVYVLATYTSLTGTPNFASVPAPPAGYTLNYAYEGNKIALVQAVANNYASWAGSQVPPVTGGVSGDDDNDGVNNLVEYALADGQERGSLSGNVLTFTKRGAPYGSDLTCAIETSTNLVGWGTPGSGVGGSGSTITYTFTFGTPPKEFARLKVTQIP